jgi:hypothetical protein
MMFEPLVGWRHVEVTAQRTQIDYAQQIKYLVDECYPQAQKIQLVQDNINTHIRASLYKAFLPAEARRILDKIEFHYTPKPGSWLKRLLSLDNDSLTCRQFYSDRLFSLGRKCLTERSLYLTPKVNYDCNIRGCNFVS